MAKYVFTQTVPMLGCLQAIEIEFSYTVNAVTDDLDNDLDIRFFRVERYANPTLVLHRHQASDWFKVLDKIAQNIFDDNDDIYWIARDKIAEGAEIAC